MDIIWSARASKDLIDIVSYIKQQSVQNAAKIYLDIKESVERLRDYPQIGVRPKDTHLCNLGYRMLIVEKYLIFYITDDTVKIVGIIHGAKRYAHLFD